MEETKMRFLKNLFIGIGAVALGGVLLTLAAPKAVHAAVATLVEVVNTPANPVPNADVNASGEEPLQAILCAAVGSSSCVGTTQSTFVVPTTTSDGLTVKRLVLEYVAAACTNNGATNLRAGLYTVMTENPVTSIIFDGNTILPLTPSSPDGSGYPVASALVRAYADPGTTVSAALIAGYTTTTGAACYYTVVGNFVTH
jgi:hypothetical protein